MHVTAGPPPQNPAETHCWTWEEDHRSKSLFDVILLLFHTITPPPLTSNSSFGAGCLSQIGTVAELDEDESVTDSQKRRVLLSRRPSYR